MKLGSKSNLALHGLIIARSMNINFRPDLFKVEQWTIKGGFTPIRPYILASGKYNWFKKFQSLTRFPIFFTEQLFTDQNKPIMWRTLKELNGLSNKGRQVLWFNQFILFLKLFREEVDSENPIARYTTDLLRLPRSFLIIIQHFQSNSYIWNFMQQSSRKHSAKPFVIFKTWDTNDRGVDAKQIFKIGKVTA